MHAFTLSLTLIRVTTHPGARPTLAAAGGKDNSDFSKGDMASGRAPCGLPIPQGPHKSYVYMVQFQGLTLIATAGGGGGGG